MRNFCEFIRKGDSDIPRRNIEAFRCPGFFNNEVVDFVMKGTSSILRIPIVIISSNELLREGTFLIGGGVSQGILEIFGQKRSGPPTSQIGFMHDPSQTPKQKHLTLPHLQQDKITGLGWTVKFR